MKAIDPPPAPIDSTWTAGARTGKSPTRVSRVIVGSPPMHAATSVDVPPMSNVSRRSYPARAPMKVAPPTPPAGPDSTVWTGISVAASRLIRPPSERTTCRPAVAPSSARPSRRLEQIALQRGRHVGVDDRGRRALVLAELGQDLRRDRQRQVWRDLGGDGGDPLLVRWVRERVHQRDAQRGDAVVAQLDDRLAHRVLVELADDLAVAVDPLAGLTDVLQRDERLGLVVDHEAEQRAGGPRLGEVQQVAEAVRGDQADARAAALEHRVGRDRRAVQDLVELGCLDARLLGDQGDALQDAPD